VRDAWFVVAGSIFADIKRADLRAH